MKNTSNHIILLLALGLSPASAAQEALSPEAVSGTNDPVKSQSTQISWTYTRHARSILKKFMRETPFDVYATAELMQQIADIPYAPDNIQAYVRQEYSLAELSKYVKQISVEVKVPEWIDSDTRNSLQEVLQRRLFLNTTRGDQVSFTNMKLKVIAPTLESTTQENTLQGETRKELLETQAKLQKLEEEFKAKDASYQDKIKDLQSQLEQSNSSPSQPSSESQDVAIKGFFADMQDHLPLVGGILLFLFITLVVTTVLPSKLFVTAINHFPKAYQGIAGAIKSLGEALQNMAPSGGGELTHPTSASPTTPEPSPNVTTKATHDDIPKDPEAFNLEKEKELLLSILQPDHDDLIVRGLTEYVNQGSLEKAVLLFEVVGKDNTDRIFPQLNTSVRKSIIEGTQELQIPPAERYLSCLEATSTMRTKILMAKYDTDSDNLNPEIRKKMAICNEETLLTLVSQLNEEQLIRLHAYLKPSQAANLIAALTGPKHKGSQGKYLQSLARYPECTSLEDKDPEIKEKIESIEDTPTQDLEQSNLAYFTQVMQSIHSDYHDTLIEKIQAHHANLAKILRTEVITFQTLFQLPAEVQGEILAKLTNVDISILLTVLAEAEMKSAVLEHFDQTKKTLIEEQSDILTTLSSFVMKKKQQEIKHKVLQLLHQMDRTINFKELLSEETTI